MNPAGQLPTTRRRWWWAVAGLPLVAAVLWATRPRPTDLPRQPVALDPLAPLPGLPPREVSSEPVAPIGAPLSASVGDAPPPLPGPVTPPSGLTSGLSMADAKARPVAGATVCTFGQLGNFVYNVDYDFKGTHALIRGGLARAKSQVPAAIRQLHGRRIALRGYMMPIDVNDGLRVSTFILTADQSLCCFGVSPAINQWIDARAAKEPLPLEMDRPVDVVGVLEVDEQLDDGMISSLYRLRAERLTPVTDR